MESATLRALDSRAAKSYYWRCLWSGASEWSGSERSGSSGSTGAQHSRHVLDTQHCLLSLFALDVLGTYTYIVHLVLSIVCFSLFAAAALSNPLQEYRNIVGTSIFLVSAPVRRYVQPSLPAISGKATDVLYKRVWSFSFLLILEYHHFTCLEVMFPFGIHHPSSTEIV